MRGRRSIRPTKKPFELLLMLEAIREAGDNFTMRELGAGYGRWMVAAACAARAVKPVLALHFVGVEGQSEHFRWMQQHFRDNGLEPLHHRLIEAKSSVTRVRWVW